MGIIHFIISSPPIPKMKIFALTAASVVYSKGVLDSLENERRYNQLVEMMELYNGQFNPQKFWTYGCNCLMLGDRPMSDPGRGQPVDDLDGACRHYKECLRCVRDQHGEQCIGEFVKYRWFSVGSQANCQNAEDTCQRDICECDKSFAEAHALVADQYQDKYHMFFSANSGAEWDPQNQCVSGTPGSSSECCGGNGYPYKTYNTNLKECCNRRVGDIGCGGGGGYIN